MSLITSVADRATWLGAASTLILRLQMLETQISVAMLDRPSHRQAALLVQADTHLGEAARSIQEAAAAIGRLP